MRGLPEQAFPVQYKNGL